MFEIIYQSLYWALACTVKSVLGSLFTDWTERNNKTMKYSFCLPLVGKRMYCNLDTT